MRDPAIVVIGIPALAAAVALLFVAANRQAARALGGAPAQVSRRTIGAGLGVAAWIALASAAAASGALAQFALRPPPLGVFMVVVAVGSLAFATSRLATPLARGLPLAALIGFQAFRLPLELVLYEAGRAGVAPTALTLAGLNFDIVTGITAIVVAPLASRGALGRRLAFAWNVLGLGLLAVIVAIAIATAPFVRALGDDQVNGWVATFPYVLLPAVLVSAALIGHVLVFRRLAMPARMTHQNLERDR